MKATQPKAEAQSATQCAEVRSAYPTVQDVRRGLDAHRRHRCDHRSGGHPTGADMSRFPTEGHFASWLGLCPGTKITGGR
ncbi:MAG: transposase [Candidatus Accumulibacter sp.]|uniref:Transposase n=1 Tax=Candidatus Accumulibacter affinis TaxID=2954384 RepID=A0A935THP8_9PROT|nr:transposase [Candidatus Accumulibacter affinis]